MVFLDFLIQSSRGMSLVTARLHRVEKVTPLNSHHLERLPYTVGSQRGYSLAPKRQPLFVLLHSTSQLKRRGHYTNICMVKGYKDKEA